MPRRTAKATGSESAKIKRRLIACLPASKFEMGTLTRLTDIVTTRSLPTAAVECTRRPRLLINPDFVEKHCQQDEHLFLLVMHELWHVMLAHTRMYPRMTTAQNIAFDAIINAGLMRQFSAPEYMGFFDALNPADDFPSCLLRPPVGWPNNPQYPEDIGPPGTREIVMRLYPRFNSRRRSMPLYEEVLNLLRQSGMFKRMPVLLGNHDDNPVYDPHMREMMEEISEQWPEMQLPMQGRGRGGNMGRRRYRISPTSEDARRVFAQTLRVCLAPRPGRERRKARMETPGEGGNGVLLNPYDRLAPARRKLGSPGTIWAQPGTTRARLPEKPARSFVYLDVSGSMNFVLSHMLHLLLPYVVKGQAEAYQFSTKVHELPVEHLRQGQLATTGGTDINCVLDHALKVEPRVKRVLILTDGETGSPQAHLARGLQEQGMQLYVVLPNGCRLDEGVQAVANSIIELPPIR